MSKELEAFKKICKNLNSYEFTDEYKKNKELIDTALIELETLEEDFMSLTETNMELVQEQAKNQKQLKALEIIKKKRTDCLMIVLTQTYIEYNDMCETEKDKLTQEEYDFLKEVLKDE